MADHIVTLGEQKLLHRLRFLRNRGHGHFLVEASEDDSFKVKTLEVIQRSITGRDQPYFNNFREGEFSMKTYRPKLLNLVN